MKTRFLALAILMAAVTLTACGFAQEEALEAQADQLEQQAEAGRKAGEAAAHAQKKQGEADVTATKANNTSSGNTPRRFATTNNQPSR